MSGSKSSVHAVPPSRADEALTFTVHSLPEPRLDVDAQRTRSGRLKMLLVLAVCAAPVIASYLTYFVIRPEGRSNYGVLIQPTQSLPADLALVDLQGRAVAAATLKQQWLLVAVAGGACDATCERTLYLQRQLRETLGRDRDRLDKVWLITDDAPVRPELLKALADAASPASTAPPPQILRVDAAALARWLRPAEGRALADHLYLVDPMGEWMMRFPADPDPGKVKHDVERLLRASSFWDRPGR